MRTSFSRNDSSIVRSIYTLSVTSWMMKTWYAWPSSVKKSLVTVLVCNIDEYTVRVGRENNAVFNLIKKRLEPFQSLKGLLPDG